MISPDVLGLLIVSGICWIVVAVLNRRWHQMQARREKSSDEVMALLAEGESNGTGE